MTVRRQLFFTALILGLTALGITIAWPLVNAGDGRRGGGGGPSAPTPVVVEPVRVEPERTRIEAVGTARAIRSATLYAAVPGEVVAVNIAPNQAVSKGDVLLELEHRSEELAVELARVRLEDARRLLRRYESTGGTGAVPESTVDEARTALEAARIQLAQARVALEDKRIVAPFDGHVDTTPFDVGDRIGTDQPVTTLDDRSALLVRFAVPEQHLGRLDVGHPVTVRTWSARERSFAGEVADLGSRIDPATRSVQARARVENADDSLRPGMSFAVTLDLEGAPRPLVPEVAVQWGADGPYLWVVRGGRAEPVTVRIVQRREGLTMVDGPLEAGEPVVVEGIQRMRKGLEVSLADPLRGGS